MINPEHTTAKVISIQRFLNRLLPNMTEVQKNDAALRVATLNFLHTRRMMETFILVEGEEVKNCLDIDQITLGRIDYEVGEFSAMLEAI